MTRHYFAILAGTFLTLAAMAEPRLHEVKLLIDPDKAEQIMAGYSFAPRLYNDQWVKVIGKKRKKAHYRVHRGDTLSLIAQHEFGNLLLWPKLWEVNPQIGNPHEISIGQILHYYQAKDTLPIVRIPLVRLKRDLSGLDIDSDSFANPPYSDKFRPLFTVMAEEEIVGEVSGGYTEFEGMTVHDTIFLSFNAEREVQPGEEFSIVRFERPLVDHTQTAKPLIGQVVKLVGDVKIYGSGEKLVRAEIESEMAPIRRGDKIVPMVKAITDTEMINPPDDFQCRLVMGDLPEQQYFNQGDLVLLNKGRGDGMKEGYHFRVLQDVDPLTKTRGNVDPDYSGELNVVYVGELSSVASVIRNTMPLTVGDTLVPYQAFPEHPRPVFEGAEMVDLPDGDLPKDDAANASSPMHPN